jgi:two-component system, OmpR family, response regulator RpaA
MSTKQLTLPTKLREVFTTGQIARLCKVAPRTVSKWFDRGELKGYRIPGSKDRRIPRANLVKFMAEHGMPNEGLDAVPVVLVVTTNAGLVAELQQRLAPLYQVERVGDAFQAGQMMRDHSVSVLITDFEEGRSDMRRILDHVSITQPEVVLAAIAGEDEADLKRLEKSYHVAVKRPFDVATFAVSLRAKTERLVFAACT